MLQSEVLYITWSLVTLCLYSKATGARIRTEPLVSGNICNSPECIDADILEMRSDTNEPEYFAKAKMFYQSCLTRDEQVDRNLEIVKERLDIWGGWPIANEHWKNEKFDWKKLLIYLSKTNDLSPLFRIDIIHDDRNTSRAIITIDQADDKFCWFHKSSKGEEHVANAIINTAQTLVNITGQEVTAAKIEEDAASIIRLEAQICKLLRKKKNRVDRSRYYTKIAHLQKLTEDTEPINEYAKINWTALLNEYLQGSIVEIDQSEEIILVEPYYVSELMELLDDVPKRTLANYMLWYHVEWMGADEWLAFFASEQGNTTKPNTRETRWKECARKTSTYFQHAVGYQYVKIYFDEDSKKKAKRFVETLLASLVEDLQNNKWMDRKTRSKAVEKAKSTKLLVGYPDWYNTSKLNHHYREYAVEENSIINMELINKIYHRGKLGLFDRTDTEVEYWPSIADVNAYYFDLFNVILVPAGILQSPFYVRGRPEALNYGAIGYIIGHEISHSFDVLGRKFDKTGSLSNWWTPDTLKIHQAKVQCIADLFSAFPTPELGEEKAWRLDGLGTVAENMADIGGIEIAYSAYKKYLRLHGPEKHLPGFANYSSEQLFFIGQISTQCETSTLDFVSDAILDDEHTPNMYSAAITVPNTKDFSATWDCKESDKMSAMKKCQFW